MYHCRRVVYRKILLVTICVVIMIFIGRFKYYGFLIENLNKILGVFIIQMHPSTSAITLPVGISFYGFKILSYVIDVYRGNKPEVHFGKYALFIAFFPEIASGPIDRGECLLPQFSKNHIFDYGKITYGLKLVAWGLFKKIVIADTLAYCVDTVYNSYSSYEGFVLILTSFFYTIQIYCDFSGYSDMAIGLAKMLDIDLCQNFRSPYLSASIKEFWRRWHISLSMWMRDYVYIPLGGNRKGKIRSYINLLVTFLFSGLWHGAGWTFLLWGGVHGLAQIIEDMGRPLHICKKNKWVNALRIVGVFAFCNFAWIFFRSETLEQALYFFRCMVVGIEHPIAFIVNGFQNLPCVRIILWKIAFLVLILFVFDVVNKDIDIILWISKKNKIVRWAIYCTFAFLIIVFLPVEPGRNFVYFQF